jgi:hypothetical protein
MAKRKKKVIDLNNHPESLKAFSWCMERNIRIYPIPSASQFKIVIDNGASKIVSPKLYDKDEWSEKIWGLYRHFYNCAIQTVGQTLTNIKVNLIWRITHKYNYQFQTHFLT